MLETPTTTLHINKIIATTRCEKHDAGPFLPCFEMPGTHGGYWPAVCNERAKAAGYFGRISPHALKARG